MVSEDIHLDELILQVFEEHENTFFWPVSTQKDAKSFVKFLHEKGAAYEDICKEIGEFEHNFSAWRKGLGRVGIGSRMIERINKTVEEVISSDNEDDTEYNLKLLSKINQKNMAKTTEKVPTKQTNNASSELLKDLKQQKEDITSSMMRNIEKVSEKIHTSNAEDTHKHQNGTAHLPSKKEEVIVKKEETTKPPPKQEQSYKKDTKVEVTKTEARKEDTKKQVENTPAPVFSRPKSPEKPKLEAQENIKIATAPSLHTRPKSPEKPKAEPEKLKVIEPSKPKAESRPEPKVVEPSKPKAEPRQESKAEPPKVQISDSPKEDSKEDIAKKEDPEMDEVKRKMEAIRRKVELMKKAKAEQAAAVANQQPAPTSGNQSTSSQEGSGDKYEVMKQRLTELRNKFMEDESAQITPVRHLEKNHDDHSSAQDSKDTLDVPNSSSVQAPLVSADEEADLSSESTESSELEDDDDEDIYDSDLDPENYDSDLDYDIYKEVSVITSKVNELRSNIREKDGPGHLYIFSDSPSNEREHRVKVGASRCPAKKYTEARKYNIALKQVSSVPVIKRNSALQVAFKALQGYKIEGERDWFKGPIDVILQKVSGATEKYGSGPALMSFDSKC